MVCDTLVIQQLSLCFCMTLYCIFLMLILAKEIGEVRIHVQINSES